MPIIESLLAEFEQEAPKTRKVLERIPTDRFDWKPHEKSFTLGQLASHLVEMIGWGALTLEDDGYDILPDFKPWQATTAAELIEKFDSNLAQFKKAMAGYPDARLMQPWTLTGGGQVFFELPRIAVLRSMIFNHLIHHRGQLTVYLRLNDLPVPAIYGPSADEAE
jgi:uncharacterized damage-inducible protein DinB